MKLGILTVPVRGNFGGILQAYALQRTIESFGHEAYIINPDYKDPASLLEKIRVYTPRIFNKYCLRKDTAIKKELFQREFIRNRCRYTWQFIDRNLKLCSIHNLKELNSMGFDGYIIGSDQIWAHRYNIGYFGNSDLYDTFGNFIKDKCNRIFSYAPSFGIDKFDDFSSKEINKISRLLRNYVGVSCREDSGTEFIKSSLAYEHAITTLDPTLLLEKQDYISLFSNYTKSYFTQRNQGAIVSYFLDYDSNKENILKHIEKKLCRKSVEINNQNYSEPQYPLEYWLHSIATCDFVVTDSFHATVFSIIFEKPVITVSNSYRGNTRLYNLLSKVELQSQLIHSREDIDDSILYPVVKDRIKKIHSYKLSSMQFIKNCIEKINKNNL